VPEPLRVLLAVTRLELGGAQRVVLHTAKTLDRSSFAVALAWGPGDRLDHEAHSIPDLERFAVPALVRPIAPLSDVRALAGLRAAIRGFRPEVVHTHSSKAGILGRLAAHLEGVPVVVHTVHGFGFTPLQKAPMRFVLRTAERRLARWTDHFITVSESNRSRGIELGLFDDPRVTVIRAGVDLRRFQSAGGGEAARAALGLPAGVPVITQIGNFKPQKGPLDFVRVAATVHGRYPDACFVMVGDGPLLGAAKQLADDLGLGGRVVFCGWHDDIPALLAATSVSVLASYHEGLPCSVVESLAAGVPVVATAVDGTVEVVRSGDNGFLAPAGDVGALAAAVCRILDDPDLAAALAARAPQGLEEFDNDLMVRQQEELYRCLGGRSRS